VSDESDPFDPKNLELSPVIVIETATAKAKRGNARAEAKARGITFVKFPKVWWEGLARARAGGSAYRLAVWLLYESVKSRPFRTGPPVVKLSNAGARRWGVGRDGKATALRVLREAGLVAVEERPKKSPLVTVRFTE
jgi:hypothetical protein